MVVDLQPPQVFRPQVAGIGVGELHIDRVAFARVHDDRQAERTVNLRRGVALEDVGLLAGLDFDHGGEVHVSSGGRYAAAVHEGLAFDVNVDLAFLRIALSTCSGSIA